VLSEDAREGVNKLVPENELGDWRYIGLNTQAPQLRILFRRIKPPIVALTLG
jgi:hypothetical protein